MHEQSLSSNLFVYLICYYYFQQQNLFVVVTLKRNSLINDSNYRIACVSWRSFKIPSASLGQLDCSVLLYKDQFTHFISRCSKNNRFFYFQKSYTGNYFSLKETLNERRRCIEWWEICTNSNRWDKHRVQIETATFIGLHPAPVCGFCVNSLQRYQSFSAGVFALLDWILVVCLLLNMCRWRRSKNETLDVQTADHTHATSSRLPAETLIRKNKPDMNKKKKK